MRERTIVPTYVSSSGNGNWVKCDGSTRPTGYKTMTYPLKGGTIIDLGSSRVGSVKCSTRTDAPMRPVEHSKWEFIPSLGPVSLLYYDCNNTPLYDHMIVIDHAVTLFWYCTDAYRLDPTPLLLEKCVQYLPDGTTSHFDRWLRAKPSMASRANLAVFLYELRDIKRMFDILPQKHFSLGSWREVIKYANSQHLNWNFGWVPFLRDIRAVVKGVSTFERRLAKFLMGANSGMLRHVGDPPAETSGESIWYTSYDQNFKYRWTWTTSVKCRSTFAFSYTVPDFDYETLRWRAMLDTLGFSVNPSNLWAVMPWSFVIDWFTGFGQYLDSYTSEWIEPWILFCQACSSYKAEVKVTYDIGHKFTVYPDRPMAVYPLGQMKYSLYSRSVGLPSASSVNPGDLSADKIRLLASLVAGLYL